MSRSTCIRVEDARALLRLAGELMELPRDAAVRGRHLVDELCRLLGGQCGMIAVLRADKMAGPPRILYGVEGGHIDAAARQVYRDYAAQTHAIDPLLKVLEPGGRQPRAVLRREFIDDRDWYGSEFVNEVALRLGTDDMVYAFYPLPTPGHHIGLGIVRPRKARFGRREKTMIALLNDELGWLYRHFASPVGEPTASLSPRLQSVLAHLLTGESEKQIARSLGLSRYTVHDYIKDVYRLMGVSSRPELMARSAGMTNAETIARNDE
jgi:DNA-binding CsgD family transcriptional regulator